MVLRSWLENGAASPRLDLFALQSEPVPDASFGESAESDGPSSSLAIHSRLMGSGVLIGPHWRGQPKNVAGGPGTSQREPKESPARPERAIR